MIPTKQDPYQFGSEFERAIVALACTNPRFFGRVGMDVDPELLKNEAAKIALRACRAINNDLGHGPDKALFVIQRLRRWMDDGKVTIEQIKKVADLIDSAEDAGMPDPEAVIVELAPILQQRLRDQAVKSAIHSFGQSGDLRKTIELEEKAQRVGQVDTSVGTMLGNESWTEVASLKDLERLRLGITELDSELDGGLQRGGLGILLGASNDGKSMGLSHIASVNVLDGLFVGYATLELPRPIVLARIKAAMTNTPINALLQGDMVQARKLLSGMSVGKLCVQDFTPYATSIEDLKEWVSRAEDLVKHEMDLLVIDYGDKVGVRKKGKDSESGYTEARVVFEGMRIWAHDRKKFCWTASQATRQKDKRKLLDLNDTADSMHKVRVADLVVTLNVSDTDGQQMIQLYVAKHRTGKSKFAIGPYPTAYDVGQLVSV